MKIMISVLVTVVMSLLLSVGWAGNCFNVKGQCIVSGATIKDIKQCKSTGKYNAECNFQCKMNVNGPKLILDPSNITICIDSVRLAKKYSKSWTCSNKQEGFDMLSCSFKDKDEPLTIGIQCMYDKNDQGSSWSKPDVDGKYTCKHNEAQKNN